MSLRRTLVSPSLWFIASISLCGYWLANWLGSIGGPEALREQYGSLAPVITGAILIILTPSPFPGDLLAIGHGSLYGFLFAGLLNWAALWLAALLEASIGKRLGADFDLKRHQGKLPAFLRNMPIEHPLFLILGRQLPVIGNEITTLLPGALGVPLLRIVWCAALGVLPGAFFFAALGTSLRTAF